MGSTMAEGEDEGTIARTVAALLTGTARRRVCLMAG